MDRTIYITDLDGTLLNSDMEISEESVRIINNLISKGLLFTYATARSFNSASIITKSLDINLPVAVYNGTFIVDSGSGKIIEQCTLNVKKIESLLNFIKFAGIYPFVDAFIGGEERVSWVLGHETRAMIDYINNRKNDKRLRPVSGYSELFEGDIYYIAFIGLTNKVLEIENCLRKNVYLSYYVQADTYNKNEYWLEIFRYDAGKGYAVQKLKKYATAQKAICFGDNINDIPMFNTSDEGYAVSNAVSKLKETACGIIDSNDDDGVAMFLNKLYSSQY